MLTGDLPGSNPEAWREGNDSSWNSPTTYPAIERSNRNKVTVTATLTDGTGTTYRTGYLHFQLVNCGANIPVVTGSEAIVQDSFDLRPATPGSSISGTIIGNDQILCGNVASTYYLVTPMKNSVHPLRDGEPYVVCSKTATLTTCGNAAHSAPSTL